MPYSLNNSTSMLAALASWTHVLWKFQTSYYHLHLPTAMQLAVYIPTNTYTQYHSTQQSLIFSHYPPITTPLSSNATTISSPQIAQIACPPTTLRTDLAHYFLTTLSPHSARGRIKKHCIHTVKSKLYNHMFEHEHSDFHLLYPIIGMC